MNLFSLHFVNFDRKYLARSHKCNFGAPCLTLTLQIIASIQDIETFITHLKSDLVANLEWRVGVQYLLLVMTFRSNTAQVSLDQNRPFGGHAQITPAYFA